MTLHLASRRMFLTSLGTALVLTKLAPVGKIFSGIMASRGQRVLSPATKARLAELQAHFRREKLRTGLPQKMAVAKLAKRLA